MRGFQKVVDEIRWSVAQVLVIPVLLDGVIAFLLAYTLLSYLGEFLTKLVFFNKPEFVSEQFLCHADDSLEPEENGCGHSN